MAREMEEIEGPESAKSSIWSLMKKYLVCQRGEIGVGEGEGGGDAGAGEGGDWDVDGKLGEGDQIQDPVEGEGDAKPLPIKDPAKPTKTPEEEGHEPEPGEGEGEGEPSDEGEGKSLPDLETLQQQVVSQTAQIDHLTKIVNWQQTKLNEPPKPQPEAQGKDAKAKGTQGPEGDVFDTPPEAWEDTQSIVQFFDKRQDVRTQNTMKEAYTEYVQPAFDRMNNAIHELINRTVKPQLKDYDDVMKDVNNELFILDPTGQNIVGYRNPALLEYFRAQSVPILAMYDYGLSKRAPTKIAEGIKKGTKETLAKLTKKPKAPTDIKGGKTPASGAGELDWDTPRDQVENILEKKRLL